jgi:hypothetical protein
LASVVLPLLCATNDGVIATIGIARRRQFQRSLLDAVEERFRRRHAVDPKTDRVPLAVHDGDVAVGVGRARLLAGERQGVVISRGPA